MINIPASVPAASSLGPGRSIPLRDRNPHNDRDGQNHFHANTDDNFDPDEVFEDIETNPSNSILDSDLDRLLGPLPQRNSNAHKSALEQEGAAGNCSHRGPGNMIVVCPRFLKFGFGIVGPHWYV
jgi:hypothetical protein